jgi:TIR domain
MFISYSRSDGESFAHRLRSRLEREGIPLWQDRIGMEGGRDWWLQIAEALNKVEYMVLVMTPDALCSSIIRKEWRYARQQGACVYPVKVMADATLNYASLPRWMRSAHFYDVGSLDENGTGPSGPSLSTTLTPVASSHACRSWSRICRSILCLGPKNSTGSGLGFSTKSARNRLRSPLLCAAPAVTENNPSQGTLSQRGHPGSL